MDIKNVVLSSGNRGEERGLLGLAFPPNFNVTEKLYFYYTVSINSMTHVRLSEFGVSGSNKNKVDINSERILLEEKKIFFNHNGGEVSE